ncbi:uncharacterized protein A4U43_C04F20740 [Asparagus officinalis]|uniref:Uncharacterized protein n=1 Tax=Asparagus officinalis TaxID=4686 RepID=A0A5P1F2K1_ASPOF|nr:uncharacterized protein A4U43_C04F20740 [Asparagus officinalis]
MKILSSMKKVNGPLAVEDDVAIDHETGLLPLADNGDTFIEVLFLGCNTSPGPLEHSFFVLGALLKPLLVETFVESQLAITFSKEFFKEFMKYNSIGYLIELLRMNYFFTHFDNVEYEDLVTQMRLCLLKDELLKLQPTELSTKLAEVREMVQPHPVS